MFTAGRLSMSRYNPLMRRLWLTLSVLSMFAAFVVAALGRDVFGWIADPLAGVLGLGGLLGFGYYTACRWWHHE
jgi:hypothetical protein